MKIATYTRVSSDKQREEKTIESQQKDLREIWQKAGDELYKDYIDDGWSGETLARPALDQLRDDAKNGLFQRLYIHHPDRLGRDHIDQGIILRELKKQGIQVVFKDVPLTEENKLQSDILALLAEYENKQRNERSRRGKLHWAKEGKIINSTAPFGYGFDGKGKKKKVVMNPKEAEIVRLIFSLYLQLQSNYKVADELSRKGVLSRKGKKFDVVKVHPILTDETYTGVWHFGKYEMVEPKKRKNKFFKHLKTSAKVKKDWVKIPIPAIIDKVTFQRVQELKEKNYKRFGEAKRLYLLSGLLKHISGEKLVGFTYYRNNRQYSYYKCNNFYLNIKRIDDIVWSLVKEALQNPEKLQEYMNHLKEGADNTILLSLKEECIKKLDRIKNKKDELWKMWDGDVIPKDELSRKIGEYRQEEKRLEKDIKGIDLQLMQAQNKGFVLDTLEKVSKVLYIQLDMFTPEERKMFLNYLIKEITINDDRRFDINGEIVIPENVNTYMVNNAVSRQSIL